MVNISLPDDVAQALTELAETQHKSIADIVVELLDLYKGDETEKLLSDDAFKAIIGIFDDPINDLSSTTRETLEQIIRDKYRRSD